MRGPESVTDHLNDWLIQTPIGCGEKADHRGRSHHGENSQSAADGDRPGQPIGADSLRELLDDGVNKPPLPPWVSFVNFFAHAMRAGLFGRV